jgi:hypothetical protein
LNVILERGEISRAAHMVIERKGTNALKRRAGSWLTRCPLLSFVRNFAWKLFFLYFFFLIAYFFIPHLGAKKKLVG